MTDLRISWCDDYLVVKLISSFIPQHGSNKQSFP